MLCVAFQVFRAGKWNTGAVGFASGAFARQCAQYTNIPLKG